MVKRKFLTAWLGVTLLAVPPPARAGEISHIMHSWRQAQSEVDAMLRGGARYDPARLQQAMAAYVADASHLAGRMNTGTADGQDLQRRFLNFAALGQQTAADISRPDLFRTDFSEVKAQCDSCHAIYN